MRGLHLVRDSEPEGEPIDAELVAVLQTRLRDAGYEHLASSVETLRVIEPCICGEAGCHSFYTVSGRQARWLWQNGGRTIQLGRGLSVDVVQGLIVAVEMISDTTSDKR